MGLSISYFKSVFLVTILSLVIPLTTHSEVTHQVISKQYDEQVFHPQTKSFNEGYLKVSDVHSIYFAEFGNPKGIPVVTLHGGPGSQCYAAWTRLFNPEIYHVIMFDQRGSGRSIPFAEMADNTPQYSIADIEQLRAHLGIDKWIIYGGSYGSFLGLLYGEAHPENCLGFVLRGIFLSRKKDYEHLFYGMKNTYPEAWEAMVADIPESERNDLITYFDRKVMDPNPEIHLPAAQAFMHFDTLCSKLVPTAKDIQEVYEDYIGTLGIGRAYIHYAANGFFIAENQILDNLSKIAHLPCIIVQGRYDVICPPATAYDLYKNWPNAELWFISDAGHATNEPGISQGLRDAMDAIH